MLTGTQKSTRRGTSDQKTEAHLPFLLTHCLYQALGSCTTKTALTSVKQKALKPSLGKKGGKELIVTKFTICTQ